MRRKTLEKLLLHLQLYAPKETLELIDKQLKYYQPYIELIGRDTAASNTVLNLELEFHSFNFLQKWFILNRKTNKAIPISSLGSILSKDDLFAIFSNSPSELVAYLVVHISIELLQNTSADNPNLQYLVKPINPLRFRLINLRPNAKILRFSKLVNNIHGERKNI